MPPSPGDLVLDARDLHKTFRTGRAGCAGHGSAPSTA